MDPARLRADFPILSRTVNGHPLTYLDSAATSQKPRAVIEAMSRFYETSNANVHRGVHALAEEATDVYEAARAAVARFVGAGDARRVVFTRNFTEAANLVAHGWARPRLRPGDRLVVTALEHHSNLIPWQEAARAAGADLGVIDLTDDGALDLGRLPEVITSRTRLVAVTAASNVLGTRVDLGPIRDAARAVGAALFVDGAQWAPHDVVEVDAEGIDFLGITGHKLLGPTGIGALIARRERLEELTPLLLGGDMAREVDLQGATWNDVPWRFEAGTPPVAEAVGLHAAIDYLTTIGMAAVHDHGVTLAARARELLGAVPGVTVLGPAGAAVASPTVAFSVHDAAGRWLHPHDVGTVIDQEGVAIRAGHHCARPLHQRLGLEATCRASGYLYTTEDDLRRLAAAVDRARDFLSRHQR
jgi:cysteine desulfurase/selenocysteine lyase